MVRKYEEPSAEMLMARKKLSQRLMQMNPTEWTEKDKQEWIKVGFKLPRCIDPNFKGKRK